jgi:ABC-type Fe3+-hydroxamate transport system substrate-binding protein
MCRCACVAVVSVWGLVLAGCDGKPAPSPKRTALHRLGLAIQSYHAPDPSPAKPMRIASAMLACDEILLDLVGAERLAAVTVYADEEGYSTVLGRIPKHIPRIRGEIESVMSVSPDLVCVGTFAKPAFLKLLERSGLRYFKSDHFHSFDEIRAGILKLGRAVGEPVRAREMVARMDARLKAVRLKLASAKTKPRVLHWSGGWTNGGENTTMRDLITSAGGTDCAAELGLKGPSTISIEQVFKANPDYVLVSAARSQMSLAAIDKHSVLKTVPAVRDGRLIRMPGPILMTVSQYVVDGVEWLARRLHPGCFAEPAPAEARTP